MCFRFNTYPSVNTYQLFPSCLPLPPFFNSLLPNYSISHSSRLTIVENIVSTVTTETQSDTNERGLLISPTDNNVKHNGLRMLRTVCKHMLDISNSLVFKGTCCSSTSVRKNIYGHEKEQTTPPSVYMLSLHYPNKLIAFILL